MQVFYYLFIYVLVLEIHHQEGRVGLTLLYFFLFSNQDLHFCITDVIWYFELFKNQLQVLALGSIYHIVFIIIPPLPVGRGGYTILPLSVLPSVQDIFRRIFLSNCWWQKSDIWSQASYRYTILWVAFLDPSDSYFLFADLVGFFIHIEHICTFFVTFFSATIDGRNLIFGHKHHIGMPYCGKCFWTRQILTSCLPT